MTEDYMTELARVALPTGEEVWVRLEVDPGVTDSVNWRKSGRFLGRLEKLDETIRGVVHSVGASVARYSPAETEVEFGIEVAGETGAAVAVLAGAHASASVKVKLKWRKGEFPTVGALTTSEPSQDAGTTMSSPRPGESVEG